MGGILLVHKPADITSHDVVVASLPYSGHIAIGDLNDDQLDDMIDVADYANGYSAAVYYHKYGLPFTSPEDETLQTGQDPQGNDIGDLNNDGLNDIAIASRQADRIQIYYQNPDHTFDSGADVILSTGYQPHDVEIADLNNDTLNDIIHSISV